METFVNHVERRLDLQVMRPLEPVTNEAVAGVPTWGNAMAAAVAASRLKDKSLAIEIDVDAAHFSKMVSGQLGVMPDKLFRFMDACGSELPLMWLLYQRGYDVEALRQRETELQREIRRLTEENRRLKIEREVITEFVRETGK